MTKNVLVILLAFGLFASAQGGLGIGGTVLVPTGTSTGRIEVQLEKSGAFLARTFSDAQGNYRFDNLTDGQYTVVVKLDGYEEERQSATFGRGGGSAQINILLTPKGGRPAANGAPSASAKYPKKVMDDYEKALDDSRKGNTDKAIERLESVVKAATDFGQAHNSLGTLYQKAQRFQDAEKEYNASLQLDPKSSEPLLNLGSLYLQIAEQAQAKRDAQAFPAALDGAVRALNQAIQLQPDSAKAYSLLGTVYYTGGQFPRAEEHLTHALQLEKGMGQAELGLANVYIKQQKWKQALEYLDAYLKDNPKTADREQIQQTRAKVAAQK
jgi:tetratricopeptide (TPR) repeat protein